MAKASPADIDMAMKLVSCLDTLKGWPATVPEAIERLEEGDDSERFDRDDRDQCKRVLNHILDQTASAGLMRVVWGCAVMLDPANQCVDPDATTIEHHPITQRAMDAKKLRPLTDWDPAHGTVLWWSDITSKPWLGEGSDPLRPPTHARWTTILLPDMPPVGELPTSGLEGSSATTTFKVAAEA